MLINKVKEFRTNMNLNQQQLGEIVGASRQTISSIERGDYSPSIVLALKIAHVFQAPVEEVFMIEEDEG
ncbi:MAG: helix-turn-helix transcriptional regulator [Erysipelotrichaceae bacterium]|nr:helix-turn-helix transcriptional regulator [Erysipelotrichaceae bacterium]